MSFKELKQPSKRLPVFVFPEELSFLTNSERSKRQIMTLYNPYDVTLNFKISSNAPQRYRVVDSQGMMKPHCCVDIVVHHLSHDTADLPGKLRVEFLQGNKLIGRKQVPVKLLDEEITHDDEQLDESNEFKYLPLSSPVTKHVPATLSSKDSKNVNGIWTIVIGLSCLIVLLLPLESESTSWPEWLHVTVSMKLMAAFVLGLVTMVILKS